ncbi:MAG: HDIG domain-containing protein [Chloroflexi bacterium]|nr:HDIG domain-containing protein [Chloroflexota bacterium]MCY3583578.1 HDIG domain-containing protein [Chloroflexota bacterium]MCY3715778.1 HDIG domain-containing protein [Chloroflexota bacterium]MDE2651494.1 HDIG domain-containing protein [Chloroflexota bacterium]MXX82614.1 HDIG domain-containing protein [Chloroflexota bacterium]
MAYQLSNWFGGRFNFLPARRGGVLTYVIPCLVGGVFALLCTLIVAFDEIAPGFNSVASLTLGSVPTEDIIAREEGSFVSAILTEQERAQVEANVPTVFYPPDPNVARQQRELAVKILAYIDNVRGDSFATLEQQVDDIKAITSLQLNEDEDTINAILQLPEDSWLQVRNDIISVLERVMRDEIREGDLERERDQLPAQVSLHMTPRESQIVTRITADVLRANTFANPEQTAVDLAAALENVQDQQRQFIAGQTVAPANQPIDALSFEALNELGLLTQPSNRNIRILRALMASLMVTMLLGLYMLRFEPQVLRSARDLLLIGALFLLALALMRGFGINNIYLMPAAALSIVYVAISTPNLAIIATIGFAFLCGLLSRSPSLEIVSLIAAGGIGAVLTLRNAGRLNNYFIAGAVVGLANTFIVAIFALQVGVEAADITNIGQAFLSGLALVPTTAFAVMYALTISLNLPTPFKLMELSQPSKPLLQRLLREAPGTYQHSLQVANLAEQAAAAIGADTQLTHVASLYHDIGKMKDPFFFTENQQHIHNPHDTLNDPYRSAAIIINHATEGDQIAKMYNLPNRIRDFIREHHGTTQVFVFHQRALAESGDENSVDPADFTYPGPIPQSRETAILMMADSCESAIRAVKPESNKKIAEVVHGIIDSKRNGGQLDASNLTLNDLKKIEDTFIDIFRGLFHPRIDYARAIRPASSQRPEPATSQRSEPPRSAPAEAHRESASQPAASEGNTSAAQAGVDASSAETAASPEGGAIAAKALDDDEPIFEVPPLPKRNGSQSNSHSKLTTPSETAETPK